MKNKWAAIIILIFLIVTSAGDFLQSAESIYNYLQDNKIIGYPRIANTENLAINTYRTYNDYYTELIPFNASDLPAILPVYFDCILINNGKEALTILDYELIQVNNKEYPISYYTYMDGGLFDSKGNKLQFPLNIDSKNSLKFYMKVGIALHPDAYVLISNNSTLHNRSSINEITSYLAIKGLDLYGNSIEPFIEQGNYFGFKQLNPENLHEQIFLVTFKTGSGNYFSDSFSWYKMKRF